MKTLQAIIGVGLVCAGVALVFGLPWALMAAGVFVLLDRLT